MASRIRPRALPATMLASACSSRAQDRRWVLGGRQSLPRRPPPASRTTSATLLPGHPPPRDPDRRPCQGLRYPGPPDLRFLPEQSGDASLTFTSQHGLVRVADLPVVPTGRAGPPPSRAEAGTPASMAAAAAQPSMVAPAAPRPRHLSPLPRPSRVRAALPMRFSPGSSVSPNCGRRASSPRRSSPPRRPSCSRAFDSRPSEPRRGAGAPPAACGALRTTHPARLSPAIAVKTERPMPSLANRDRRDGEDLDEPCEPDLAAGVPKCVGSSFLRSARSAEKIAITSGGPLDPSRLPKRLVCDRQVWLAPLRMGNVRLIARLVRRDGPDRRGRAGRRASWVGRQLG